MVSTGFIGVAHVVEVPSLSNASFHSLGSILSLRPKTRYQRCSLPATAFAWTTRVKRFDDVLEDSIEVDIVSNY